MSTNPSWQTHGRSNLYAKLQLFNSKDVLLASVAPAVPTATSTRLDFNLPSQGSYFLAVVKSGFGDPKGDGFSSYGSVGGCTRARQPVAQVSEAIAAASPLDVEL